MTPKQSLIKQSLIRRSFAVLTAALLFTACGVVLLIPANAAPVKGSLEIVGIRNTEASNLCISADRCVILQDQQFEVQVRVLDSAGQPTSVSKATTIRLREASGAGSLDPEQSTVTIPRNGTGATFSGLTYSPSANPTLRAEAVSGVQLNPDDILVHIAITATDKNSSGADQPLDVVDQACVIPTPDRPTCGHWLLPNGANGQVVMAVGSCDGIGPAQSPSCRSGGRINALVITALGDLGGLYTKKAPATMILACDKVVCGGTGVPKLPVLYTFDDASRLTQTAPECPSKGVLAENQDICVDYVQSTRSDGDLYTYVLFDHDARFSH